MDRFFHDLPDYDTEIKDLGDKISQVVLRFERYRIDVCYITSEGKIWDRYEAPYALSLVSLYHQCLKHKEYPRLDPEGIIHIKLGEVPTIVRIDLPSHFVYTEHIPLEQMFSN